MLMGRIENKELDANEFRHDAQATPARLGVGRAGPRYTTAAMLALRADHARAVDAVMTEDPRDWARRNGLHRSVIREAATREDYIALSGTRPPSSPPTISRG